MKLSNNSSLVSTNLIANSEDWGPLMQRKASKNDVQVKGGQTPCRFYQLGQCSKGAKCSFMHKKASHFTQTQCKFFVNGFCRNGDRCPFSHQSQLSPRRKSSSDAIPTLPHKNDTTILKSPTDIVKLKQKKHEIKNLNGSKNGYNVHKIDFKDSNGVYAEDASNGHLSDDAPTSYCPDDLDLFFDGSCTLS